MLVVKSKYAALLTVALFLLWRPSTALAVVEETGSLRGFLLDSCAACSYDNWLSHVSERNVRANYNDYGPPNLDPVTNGFGGFTYIPINGQGNLMLAHWRSLFDFALDGQWPIVDSMLALYNNQWNYELVHLWEQDRRHDYYLLRERLDMSFVDRNGDNADSNDVIGGFRKGWGVFVFNPAPRHPNAIIQVPHPEDDFMAPPAATEMFIRDELAILMIAGAGREVMWDSLAHPTYDNAYSYSDPSRNGRAPFQMLTEAAKDAWDAPPLSQFIVIQLHSYDYNEHYPLGDMQVSCFHDDIWPNTPIRDAGFHHDFVHAMGRYPVHGIDGDESVMTPINEYITLWCNPEYSFFGDSDTVGIRSIEDYLGALENQQAIYCHETHDFHRDNENFIHIELDEYPDALWQPVDWQRWLPGYPPARLANFRVVLEYYSTFIDAVDSMLTWNSLPDTIPPLACRIVQVEPAGSFAMRVIWNPPARDMHFDTYQILFDTTTITELSPSVTRSSPTHYADLAEPATRMEVIYELFQPPQNYRFAIRALDSGGNYSMLSPEWGMIDSVIHDLTIHVENDSLKLNWTGQYYDSTYQVWEYPSGANSFYIIGATDTTNFTMSPAVYSNNRVSIVKIKRILRN